MLSSPVLGGAVCSVLLDSVTGRFYMRRHPLERNSSSP